MSRDVVEPKPCPFCGGKAETTRGRFVVPKKWLILWGVICDGDCGTHFDSRAPSEEKAIKAWNTRDDTNELTRLRKREAALVARYEWATNELLACDYGDNNREGETGWRVYGWRSKSGASRIYGSSIDEAIDAEIALKEPKQ